MATLDPILDLIRPQIALCPEVSMQWATVMAARRFCQETRFLRETSLVDTVEGQQRYRAVKNWDASTPELAQIRDNVEIIGIYAAQVGADAPQGFSSPREFPQTITNNDLCILYPPDQVAIFDANIGTTQYGLRLEVILQPVVAATVVPDRLITLHDRRIATGAIAILKAMHNEAWTDKPGSLDSESEFRDEIAIAQVRSDMQHRPRMFRTVPYV